MRLKNTISRLLFISLYLIGNVSFAQDIDALSLMDVSTSDSIDASGNYIVKGKIKNNGTTDFQGEVSLVFSNNNNASVMANVPDNVSFEENIGYQSIAAEETQSFEFTRNALTDKYRPSFNIICVWPKLNPSGKEGKRNIICVWPKKNKKDKKDKGKRVANPTGKDKKDLSYTIYPNPLVGITYLLVSSETDKEVEIDVVNNLGQHMKLVNASLTQGQSFVEIDLNEFGDGVYFFNIRDGVNPVKTKKVIKN